MGKRCAVSECPNNKSKLDFVHEFPSGNQQLKFECWRNFAVQASGGSSTITKFEYYGICENHFTEEDYSDVERKKLKVDAVPSRLNGKIIIILEHYLQVLF